MTHQQPLGNRCTRPSRITAAAASVTDIPVDLTAQGKPLKDFWEPFMSALI